MGIVDATRGLRHTLLSPKSWRRKGKQLLARFKARWRRNNDKEDKSSIKAFSVDQAVVLEAYNQAVVARNKGQFRLALLLAHQCECVAGDPPPPEVVALIADLRRSIIVN
jgi:hypothetical protein